MPSLQVGGPCGCPPTPPIQVHRCRCTHCLHRPLLSLNSIGLREGIQEFSSGVEDVGALPPHPHWGVPSPDPCLGCAHPQARGVGVSFLNPFGLWPDRGGAFATLRQPSGGVCYQYISFYTFSVAKIRTFFEPSKFFERKMQMEGVCYQYVLLNTFSGAKLNLLNFGI